MCNLLLLFFYMLFQVIVVLAINWICYEWFLKKQLEPPVSRNTFLLSTVLGLVFGFIFGLESIYFIKKIHSRVVLAVLYATINILLSELIYQFFFRLSKGIINRVKPLLKGKYSSKEVVEFLNYFTRFFVIIFLTIWISIPGIAYAISYLTKSSTSFFDIGDLSTLIILTSIEVFLYIIGAFIFYKFLVREKKITDDYSKLRVICLKSCLAMLVALVGLYTIINPSSNISISDMGKLIVTGIATSLYPVCDIWIFIYDRIKEN